MSPKLDPTLETGYQEIDEQHRRIFRSLSELVTATRDGRSREVVVGYLSFLEDYVLRHFGMEETIMEATEYPGLQAHRAEHVEFSDEVAHIKAQYLKTGTSSLVTIKLQTCSVRWLRDHIKTEDKKMATFLKTVPPP